MQSSPWLFAFHRDRLVLKADSRVPTVAEVPLPAGRRGHPVGPWRGRPAMGVRLPDDAPLPDGCRPTGLRALFGLLGEEAFVFAGRAFQILEWDRNHRFCGRCGGATAPGPEDLAVGCASCGLLHYPRITPAVIFLVHRGEEALLARSPGFRPGGYSTLAGFVEPGETLETAVTREAEEEVGVALHRVRYYGSQPWPFPHSLMIGFTAEYAGGEIRCQEGEIEDARWFHVDALPPVSKRLSIARRLIEWFVARHGRDPETLTSVRR